jgi:hypothetical protein
MNIIKVALFLCLSFPALCIAGGKNLFEEIVFLTNKSENEKVNQICFDESGSFEPHNFLCAYLNSNDEYFIEFIYEATQKKELRNLWNMERLTYANTEINQTDDVLNNGSYVTRSLLRFIRVMKEKESHPGKWCKTLAVIYQNSDGFFRGELINLLSHNSNNELIFACIHSVSRGQPA